MMKSSEEQLLREYLRESILIERDISQQMGRQLISTIGGAAGKAISKNKAAIKGRAKDFLSSLKHLIKGTVAGAGEVASAGLFKADWDKIHGDRLKDLQDIKSKYGSAMEQQFDSPFLQGMYVLSMLTMPGAALAVKAGEKISKTAQKKSLKVGSSKGLIDKVDAYFGDLEKKSNEIPNIAKREIDRIDDEEKREKALRNLRSSRRIEMIESLKNEKKQLEDALRKSGKDPSKSPVIQKYARMISDYQLEI